MLKDEKYKRCPLCNHLLQKRKEGYVCRTWKKGLPCPLYWKLGTGWIYQIKGGS